MEKLQSQKVRLKVRGWKPTLTQVAERANRLWHQDGCPETPEVGYWLRALEELRQEHQQLVAAEDYTTRATVGMENVSTLDRRRNSMRLPVPH